MAARRKSSPDRARFRVVLGGSVFLLALIGARLGWVQVVRAEAYGKLATEQRLRDIELSPRRGTIYDREGEPLAVSLEARTIYAAPNTIKDRAGTARALASVLGGDVAAYEAKLSRDTGFVYIARKVDMDRAKTLEEMKLEGIGFLEDSQRSYPSGDLASQVLGFVGVDGQGLAGVEKQYDSVLAGKAGVLLGERDPYGRPIPGGVQKSLDPVDGHDVILTIDKDIQYQAQLELAAAVKKWGAKGGSVVIMNPRDGEIYAMASTPTFNPNDFKTAPADAFRNKPISDSYEPGSTLKSLTAAAVIDKGLYTPESMFQLPPTLKVGGRTIHESHPRGAVNWSLTQIVTNSSNVGAVKLGMKLGKEGLYDYFAKFGLTETPGTDFPGTARGWLPPTSQWSASSIANIPFGQGISVTPLQLARAISAIAADGELPTPHFLMSVPQDEGVKLDWPKKRAITEQSARTTSGVLRAVVTEGTGKAAEIPGYTVAGKTGTAQKAAADGSGYAKGKYIGSFIGYLPAEDPQLLICVTIDEPSNAIYGGTVAAPTFAALASFAAAHLKIVPSTVVSPGQGSIVSSSTAAPSKAATRSPLPTLPSSGTIVPPTSDQGARD